MNKLFVGSREASSLQAEVPLHYTFHKDLYEPLINNNQLS